MGWGYSAMCKIPTPLITRQEQAAYSSTSWFVYERALEYKACQHQIRQWCKKEYRQECQSKDS